MWRDVDDDVATEGAWDTRFLDRNVDEVTRFGPLASLAPRGTTKPMIEPFICAQSMRVCMNAVYPFILPVDVSPR
jgi:hypothetical protein